MTTTYNGRYRIASARLPHWDYGSNGIYFITICTHNRVPYFGTIEDHVMHCHVLGELAKQYWLDIPHHFDFVELGNFVVMPNHVHGILIINKKHETENDGTTPLINNVPSDHDVDAQLINNVSLDNDVETRLIASLPPRVRGGITGDKNPMLHDNISKIIRWYKGRCSFEIRKHQADFQWQARFYDRIVRDAEAYERVHWYIEHNPRNWKEDKLFKK